MAGMLPLASRGDDLAGDRRSRVGVATLPGPIWASSYLWRDKIADFADGVDWMGNRGGLSRTGI